MEEKIIKNPFGFKNLGDGRVMVSLTINYYLIIGIIVFTIALAAIGAILYGLGLGIVALVKLLWSVKWWVLGSLLAILVAWLLSKILKNIKSSNNPNAKRNWGWFGAILAIILAAILSIFLFKGCENEKVEEPTKPEVVVAEATLVTEERFGDPSDWIILDAYLSEGFNVMYVDFQKFDSYGQVLTYKDRISCFDGEAYHRDWGKLFPYFEGKAFSNEELAALKRYGLWCGLAGFEASPIWKKLQNGEAIVASDLAKVYTSSGEERTYRKTTAEEHARKYAWMLMVVFDGNVTIEDIKSLPVMSYKSISLEEMYDAEGNYIFNEEIRAKLIAPNGNRTTKEVLQL
ncbi:MAG: hypothetical protein IJW75_03460 [Alphaproteobacteria bacterium]|nr:hypothetical protein [Alphaproteobacteria bacterium]